ncbi:DNA pilot protein [Microviridae sp.]|nr:DNA pilot protein [Microviridae sp.]
MEKTMDPMSAGIGAGASLVGAYFQNRSAKSQAKRQMDFQERMSSTAHQREVKDLRKAGLNPMLSAMSGASTPAGAQAPISNIAENAVSSAVQAGTAKAQLKLLQAQADKTKAEATITEKSVPKAELEADMTSKLIEMLYKGASTAKDIWTGDNTDGYSKSEQDKKTPFINRIPKH